MNSNTNKIKKKRRKLKKSVKNIMLLIIIAINLVALIVGVYNLVLWKLDNNVENEEIIKIEKEVEVIEQEDTDETEIIEQTEPVPSTSLYWKYIQMKLINVDFTDLKNTNNDTVGWLQVGGTNINYPFVQASDNEYYLTHSFEKKKNQAGWAFMDYRNDKTNFDKNTIIYGHALKSGAIFGTLNKVIKTPWFNDKDNHIIKLSTESENTLWQVFSVYTIPDTTDYLQIRFSSNEQFKSFANMLLNRSIRNFETTVSETDIILTLSSCYGTHDTKVVLHAKLIKREKK